MVLYFILSLLKLLIEQMCTHPYVKALLKYAWMVIMWVHAYVYLHVSALVWDIVVTIFK